MLNLNIHFPPHGEQTLSNTQTNHLTLFTEIIGIHGENKMGHNTLCGTIQYAIVTADGTERYYQALNS
jgi:hypothetical protein